MIEFVKLIQRFSNVISIVQNILQTCEKVVETLWKFLRNCESWRNFCKNRHTCEWMENGRPGRLAFFAKIFILVVFYLPSTTNWTPPKYIPCETDPTKKRTLDSKSASLKTQKSISMTIFYLFPDIAPSLISPQPPSFNILRYRADWKKIIFSGYIFQNVIKCKKVIETLQKLLKNWKLTKFSWKSCTWRWVGKGTCLEAHIFHRNLYCAHFLPVFNDQQQKKCFLQNFLRINTLKKRSYE